ncbi:MAG: DNA topoisomerase III [Methylacidiphilales bacterium]|nr:DNA topoisomerase III [Candidatus Methylacidiphilales bacterium]
MSKSLIIAEKPSVAADIAKALGGFKKQNDYYESETAIITSAVGHLLELCVPAEMEKKKGKWTFEALPVIPAKFELKPIEKTEARLKLIKKLIARQDVNVLVNACDAGREGELIFRYIVQYCGTKKPIRRLWLQSMTPDAIREGFEHLRADQELLPLAAAAVSRNESDWLIGINGTRALTALNNKDGGFYLTTVGRVQTPTLAIVVDREIKIKNFVPRTYYELHATFAVQAGTYVGKWFDPDFKKSDTDEHARAERIWERAKAESILKACQGQYGEVEEEKKTTTQAAPLLFDLTTLQREANARLGLPAKRTLAIAQALYERHKVITYPRTDARALPEDYLPTVRKTLAALRAPTLAPFAQKVLDEGWLRMNKRVFDNSKISDHFAIIPTTTEAKHLDEMEMKIYEIIAKRLIAIFYPPAEFEVVTRITRVAQHCFKSEGKVLIEAGWLAVYGREDQSEEDSENRLVPVKNGEKPFTEKIELKTLQTKPPARFTEATLLSAMEGAGKLIEDEQLREAMGKKGLGTPATRAAIIEGLISEKYIDRLGKELVATPKAFALMEQLKALDIETLRSPELTGEWEYKLKQIEAGEYTREQFMSEIVQLTRTIVDRVKNFEESRLEPKPFPARSPIDGAELVETLRYYQTRDGSFRIAKVISGRVMQPHEVIELIEKRKVGPFSDFISRKFNRPFTATLILNDENKVEFLFSEENRVQQDEEIINSEPIGVCPVDGAKVYETASSYICENALGQKASCNFKISKKILNQIIDREQAAKLLQQRRTDLLTGFISARTKKPFRAYLELNEENKVVFAFPDRTAASKT